MISSRSESSSRDHPHAVVIGVDSLQGLQAARVLAARRIPIIAIARTATHYGSNTNVCKRIVFAPTDDAVLRTLLALGPKLTKKAVLFPCSDGKVRFVSRNRDKLRQWYHVVLPAEDVVEMLTNKVAFYQYCQQNQLPIPPTFFLSSRTDAERAAREIRFPAILKPPSRSATWVENTNLKAFRVRNKDEFLAHYDHLHRWSDVLILQQSIEGDDRQHYTCNGFFDEHSNPQATFVSRKLRQWPPKTGQGCLSEACSNDVVLNTAVGLFHSLNFYGLGYLEMKRDVNSGQYFIIEPNIGRPTGRSASAEACGVELLYSMYCDAVGWTPPLDVKQSKAAIKWIFLRQDLQAAVHHWRRNELTTRQWWQSRQGKKVYAVWSWRDPAPFLFDLIRCGRVMLSARERQRRGLEKPVVGSSQRPLASSADALSNVQSREVVTALLDKPHESSEVTCSRLR